MFREMRRDSKKLPGEEATRVLKKMTNGTLALDGVDGYPYAVPVSYVYCDDKIYFHGAAAGQKHESLLKNNKVSFSVVEKDDIKPEKFTTHYVSVLAYGRVRVLNDPEEIQRAMEYIVQKYSPEHMDSGRKYIASKQGDFCAYELTIEYLTAKGVK